MNEEQKYKLYTHIYWGWFPLIGFAILVSAIIVSSAIHQNTKAIEGKVGVGYTCEDGSIPNAVIGTRVGIICKDGSHAQEVIFKK